MKRKKLLIIINIVTLVILGGAGLYYFLESRATAEKLNETENKLQAATTAAKDTKTPNKPTETPKAATTYTTLPFMDAKFKQTDETKDIVFAYSPQSTDTSVDAVMFTTRQLSRVLENQEFPCSLTKPRALPSIIRYSTDREIPGGLGTASQVGRKVGDSYYVFRSAQSLCTSDQQQQQLALNQTVKNIYTSLEPAN